MTSLTPQQKAPFDAFPADLRRLRIAADGKPAILHATEADIRRNLAKLAYAYGWQVRQEVVIPWGRIDLVLSDRSPGSILIELKQALSKPSEVRRGFQQADGYGRWWVANRDEPARVILSAAAVVTDVATAAAAYPEVQFLVLGAVMGKLATWGDPVSRIGIAQSRADELSMLLEVHDYAVKQLGGAR